MKKLLLLGLLITCINSIGQDTIIDTRNQLELIADELNISEIEAFDSLVKEQTIQAYRNLVILFTMLLAGYFFRKYLHNAQHNKAETKQLIEYGSKYGEYKSVYIYDNKWIVLAIITGLIFISSLIYNSIMLSDTFTGLFNPEYGALEQLNFLTNNK